MVFRTTVLAFRVFKSVCESYSKYAQYKPLANHYHAMCPFVINIDVYIFRRPGADPIVLTSPNLDGAVYLLIGS